MSPSTFDLQNKLEGDHLNLSTCRLTKIPLEEIALIPNVTKLDLSNNEIVSLPPNFAECLQHITKLDLSTNKLKELPNNIGKLTNLKHLDLYNNKLTDLPLSFSYLKNLKYLNLRENPLRVDLSKEAGNCLNRSVCQRAAVKIVSYLDSLRRKKDREYIIEDLKLRKKEMAKQVQGDKKAKEKEKRREKQRQEAEERKRKQYEQIQQQQNYEQKKQQQREQQKSQPAQSNYLNGKATKKENSKKALGSRGNSRRWSWVSILNIFLLCSILASAATCLVLYSEGDFSKEGLKKAWPKLQENLRFLQKKIGEVVNYENFRYTTRFIWSYLGPCLIKVQETLNLGLSATKNLALTLAQALKPWTGDLGPYFEGLVSSLCSLYDFVISKFDFVVLCDGVKWFSIFIGDQFLILREELWSNEAVLAMWKDLEPAREFLWINTSTLRFFFWQLQQEVNQTWLPYCKGLAQDFYHLSTNFSSADSVV